LDAAKNAQALEDGARTQAVVVQDLASRNAMSDTWKSRADNNMFFKPQSIEDDMETIQQKAEETSRAAPKAVIYDNTRLQQTESAETAIPASPSLSAVKDAITGRPRLTGSEAGSYTGNEIPRVNGYAFVDSEPSPEAEEPWQDWSKISLGLFDATPNPFTIKEKSSRESLHHWMVDKVAKGKRLENVTALSKTPVPKFTSSPKVARDGMTPAA
jgi:protein DGCR14